MPKSSIFVTASVHQLVTLQYPEIFKCYSIDDQMHSPFDWYFEHLDPTSDRHSNEFTNGDVSPLTGQTTALVHLALNFWNGHEFDLVKFLQSGIPSFTKLLYKQ